MNLTKRKRIVDVVLKSMEVNGFSVTKACEAAGLSINAFYTWSKQEGWEWILEKARELRKVNHETKAESVELTLVQRALGYIHKEQEFRKVEASDPSNRGDGMGLYKEIVKPVAGNITAIIFLLCNLAKEGLTSIPWQNVQEIEIDHSKIETVDQLIKKMFADDKKQAVAISKSSTAKISITENAKETEEEAKRRKQIRLEMQDES